MGVSEKSAITARGVGARPRLHPTAAAAALLSALQAGTRIDRPAIVVAAHPDDETIGLGGRLSRFTALTLVHVTDGAPLSLGGSRQMHSAMRAEELGQALQRLRLRPHRLELGLVDQTAALHLSQLARRLRDACAAAELVVTHAYEGGHPDHDACAWAVQAACDLLASTGRRPPLRLEFAGYHRRRRGRITGAFWPDAACPSVEAVLGAADLAAKRAALACFQSQAEIVAWFDPAIERYRPAPRYDFSRPPPPGSALYDEWGWELSSAKWRELACAALADLGLERRR